MSDVSVYVDIHEEQSKINLLIRDVLRVPVILKKFETGDVIIRKDGYSIGIELKRKTDFDNSLHKGRLHDQLARLTETYDFPILIIEGWAGDDWEMHDKQVRTLNRRVCVYQTGDMADTVEIIGELIRDLNNKKLNVIRRPVIIENDNDPRIPLLCTLPHVSKVTAHDILRHYGSLKDALSDVEGWIKIHGIGGKTVMGVKELMEDDSEVIE